MDREKVVQFECKVCGRRIDVTRTGEVYEEPVYCCGVESSEAAVQEQPVLFPTAAKPKKKPAKKKAKKAAKKKAKKKARKKAVKKVAKKKAKKKAVKKRKKAARKKKR